MDACITDIKIKFQYCDNNYVSQYSVSVNEKSTKSIELKYGKIC